jgi:membrane protease YdiL (CAAX protease family)
MRHSGYSMSFYGLNRKNWFNNSVVAISLTIPLMLLILIIKWALITFIPSLQGIRLFDPGAIFKKGTNFYLSTYLSSLFAYALFCPLQEFIIRGGIQTSLENFFDKEQKKSTWLAILVSNLLFASAHSHTSPGFALSAFIPGLFWGWLYARQRSLIGVGISHVLLGVWAAFIVGFQNII